MNYLVYLNGKIVPENEAYISIKDRGFLYGDGLFETIRAYKGHTFRLDEHLDRLSSSAKELKIHLNHTPVELCQAVQNLLNLNGLADAYIRITLTSGQIPTVISESQTTTTPQSPPSQGGDKGEVKQFSSFISQPTFHIPRPEQPTLVIEARPLTPYPQEYYKHGISIVVSKTRISTSWPLAAHKTLNFMNNILAREDANSLGAQEVLFLNTDGHVAECSVSNLLLVKNNEVITPSLKANILPGITRKVVLEICKQSGIVAREDLFSLERLMDADEVFLTNSLMEVMPVSAIDNQPSSPPVPGKLTKHIMEAYRKLTFHHYSDEW